MELDKEELEDGMSKGQVRSWQVEEVMSNQGRSRRNEGWRREKGK